MADAWRLKACPVVLRGTGRVEVLAFEHPLAGLQLVKGSVEASETAAQAAVRELREESGVVAHVVADLGTWDAGFEQQRWSLSLCEPHAPLPDGWVHQSAGDEGHAYRFFWHPLGQPPSDDWHDVYRRALAHIAQWLRDAGSHSTLKL
ncbi:NUDIX hydrolase [Ramlibacter algicola]|uniref:NUDIX domain-containing protein n=1 Tax=Ramlibacter algicola TaxID=2795217 RepID=A0A934Q2I5_9BURK|nr:NUDIX domain-containing protein [Ramlibacter algicola]MBK0394819.1 NUDIX domain-containing protein [Ramlibacter algicola]